MSPSSRRSGRRTSSWSRRRVPASTVACSTTEFQSAGRGRLDRVWTAPARSGLAVSVLLTPPVSGRRWSWLPLVTGLAVLDAVRSIDLPATVTLGVKWPNDVLVDGAKVAGILAERVDDRRVVIGLGLNVSLTEAELPVPTATSLQLAGAQDVDRTALLLAYLDALATHCRRWWAEPDDEAGAQAVSRRRLDGRPPGLGSAAGRPQRRGTRDRRRRRWRPRRRHGRWRALGGCGRRRAARARAPRLRVGRTRPSG